jgi:hypothetical protein
MSNELIEEIAGLINRNNVIGHRSPYQTATAAVNLVLEAAARRCETRGIDEYEWVLKSAYGNGRTDAAAAIRALKGESK